MKKSIHGNCLKRVVKEKGKKEEKNAFDRVRVNENVFPRRSKNKNGRSRGHSSSLVNLTNVHLNAKRNLPVPIEERCLFLRPFHYTRVRNEWSPATDRYQLIDFHYFKP